MNELVVYLCLHVSDVCKLWIVPLVFGGSLHDQFNDGRKLCEVDDGSDERGRQGSTPAHMGENPGLKQNNSRAISPRHKNIFITVVACHASAPNMAKASRCHISFFSHSQAPRLLHPLTLPSPPISQI